MSAPCPARIVAFGLLAAAFVQAGCFDARIPADAVVGCRDDDECPAGFRCAPVLAVCASAGDFGRLCGDGVRAGDEDCDDGEDNDDTVANACRSDCRRARCGDAVVDDGEDCDDGPANSDAAANACRSDCTVDRCGDGVTDGDEECDDGNGESGDGCRADCRKIERCGDAIVDVGEACDDGNDNPADGCDGCRTSSFNTEVLVAGGALEPRSRLALSDAAAVVVDANGRLFVAEAQRHRVLRIANDGTATVVAGTGAPGFSGDGGRAAVARLNLPSGLALDAAGRLFIADTGNHRIRRVDVNGNITTVAGSGGAGFGGDAGNALAARLNGPMGVHVDRAGHLLIADTGNHRVRRVDVEATITTIAGDGTSSSSFFPCPQPSLFNLFAPLNPLETAASSPRAVLEDADGRIIFTAAGDRCVRRINGNVLETPLDDLGSPSGLALAADGDLLVVDTGRHTVLRLDGSRSSTLAGQGAAGFSPGGAPGSTLLNAPAGVGVAPDGAIFVADNGNARVGRIDPTGVSFETWVGTQPAVGDGSAATSALLASPAGIARDGDGFLVVDTGHHRIRRIDARGVITTAVGCGYEGSDGIGGPAADVFLRRPEDVTTDGAGGLVVVDSGNDRILLVDAQGGVASSFPADDPSVVVRADDGSLVFAERGTHSVSRRAPDGTVTRLAGTGTAGFSGDAAPATSAQLSSPSGLAFVGPDLFIADNGNGRIRRIDAQGVITTVAGGDGTSRIRAGRLLGDSVGRLLFFDIGRGIRRRDAGELTTVLSITNSGSFTLDENGDLVVVDTSRSVVFARRGTPGVDLPLAGAFDPFGPGPFSAARLYPPRALALVDDNLLVSVGDEGRALGLDLIEASVGIVVGSATGSSASGSARLSTLLADARSVVFDAARHRLVIGEHGTGTLRFVDVDSDGDGTTDPPASWSSSVLATGATGVSGVAVDDDGFVVARDEAHCVVRLDAAGQVVGAPLVGTCGTGGPPPLLDGPSHVALGRSGAVYVSDTGNNAVLRVAPDGSVDVVVGNLSEPSSSGQGTPAREFPVNRPGQLAFDSTGNLYIASTTTVRLVSIVDGDDEPDGDDRIQTIYGNGNRTQFPERDSQCIAALAIADDDTVYVADRCLGFVVRLTRQTAP
jgi:cysteine-rich repeat protein